MTDARVYTIKYPDRPALPLSQENARRLQSEIEAVDWDLGQRVAHAWNNPDPDFRFEPTEADTGVIAPITQRLNLV